MPIDPIPNTPAGWPYLPDNAPIPDMPAYTQQLAAALAGFAPGAGAPAGDTGWVAITPVAPATVGNNAAVRVIGGVAYFRGTLAATLPAAGATTVATIPAGCRPVEETYTYRMLQNATSASKPVMGLIQPSGSLIVYSFANAGAVSIGLAGFSGIRLN